ncbi:MAG: hypothetical protein ACREQA_23045 [Candidatus Binatia bacterium]
MKKAGIVPTLTLFVAAIVLSSCAPQIARQREQRLEEENRKLNNIADWVFDYFDEERRVENFIKQLSRDLEKRATPQILAEELLNRKPADVRDIPNGRKRLLALLESRFEKILKRIEDR